MGFFSIRVRRSSLGFLWPCPLLGSSCPFFVPLDFPILVLIIISSWWVLPLCAFTVDFYLVWLFPFLPLTFFAVSLCFSPFVWKPCGWLLLRLTLSFVSFPVRVSLLPLSSLIHQRLDADRLSPLSCPCRE